MIRGLFLIFVFYWLGEAVSGLLNGFIPGSVIGMLALFGCLLLRIVKPHQVRETAKALTAHMALFLTPAAVGIMMYIQSLLRSFVPIAVAILVSTTLTILVVALIQQFFENKVNRNSSAS